MSISSNPVSLFRNLIPKVIRENSLTGFTLIELIIVIIIVGILATFALPQFATTKERALDKEAKANLKLIYAAQKIYRMETNNYIACADTSAVNSNLKLSIPSGSPNWNYKVDVVIPSTTFTGKALRVTDLRVWCINQSIDDPYQSGCAW